MTWSRGRHSSGRERPTGKLHYRYGEAPAGIEDDWSEAASRAVIPDAAVARFRAEHPEVSAKGTRRVERALLQWVRIEGRSPGTHELPSRAVEALWRSLRSNEGDWEIFRDSLGLELHPGLDALTHWVPDDDSEPMRATSSDAFDDELPAAGFPALFIVDGEVGIAEVAIDPQEHDTAPSPDTFDLYEPAEAAADPYPDPRRRDAVGKPRPWRAWRRWRDGRVRTALVGIAVSSACLTLIVAIAMVMRSRANDAAAKYDIEGGIYLAAMVWILATVGLLARIVHTRKPGPRADVAFSTPPIRLLAVAVGSCAVIGLRDAGLDVAAIAALAGVGLTFVYWGIRSR
jgi:hypothetical protein